MNMDNMARRIEASHNWLETPMHRGRKFSEAVDMARLAAPIASLDVQSTLMFEVCGGEASRSSRALAYTGGGPGAIVERLYRGAGMYAKGYGSKHG
ncbi:hypothetical protein PG984_012284 [Apiospora sp. TS-2023a]